MKQISSLLLAMVLTLGLIAGCAAPAAQPTPMPSGVGDGSWIGGAPATDTPETPAPQEVSAWPMTVTDQAGRTVEIPAQPAKIVSGYYISTSACIALGLTDKMVGIEKKIIPIYQLAAPAFLELPNVGTAKEFDLEGCIALEPDLVILPKKLKDAAETMAGLGIPVLLVSPENQAQLVEMLTLIGAATGQGDIAAKLVKTYEDSAAKLEALSAQLTDEQKPLVYMGGNGALLSTAPKDMYQASLIRLGGGVNAGDSLEGDSWTEVSYEQVIAMNPDVIILPSDASYTVDDVKNDAQLANVTAVQNGAVYAMPGDLEAWDSPVPSCLLGAQWMMSTLHPDLLTEAELDASVAAFYLEFYGVTIAG